jgi:transketolase
MKNNHLTDYQNQPTYATTRDGFGEGLVELAEKNPAVVGLCADLTESTRMNLFAARFPERFLQVGVAEENLVGLSAGLALAGKIPFAASYAVFSPANSWGPIRSSICYSNLNVKLIGGHAGITTGADGATHQALEDIAMMRVLPNMTVVVPADKEEARQATIALASQKGPCYLRTGKHNTLNINTKQTPFTIGKAIRLREGSDLTFIACGNMVAHALLAAEELEKAGVAAAVINMHTIKPIDVKMIEEVAKQSKLLVSLEEHQVAGGLGSAITEVLAMSEIQVPIEIIGINDQFGESGKPEELLAKYGLDLESIINRVQKRWERVLQ